jgi:Protein of unknown function (DUF2800)
MIHSPLGASIYHRWKECPGSVRLNKDLKSLDSPEATRGRRAHELAELWIKNRLCPKGKFQDLEQEDFEAVEVYYDFVESILGDRNDKDLQFWLERRFDLSKHYPQLFGTADFACYSRRHEKLVVVDYKHGAGHPVEVKENPQLQYYGVGALLEIGLPVKSVELVVVQPRCPHKDGVVRKWQTTSGDLLHFLDNLVSDAKKTAKPNAKLSVGDWCKYCPAAAVNCPKIREKSLKLASETFSEAAAYNPEKLSEVLYMLPTMEAWIRNVRAFATSEAQAGRVPPGFKIVNKRPMRRWKDEFTGERLAQEFGLKPPEIYDQKIKSPAQVEKMISKDLRSKVDTLVDKVSSGYKLVESDDPTPEVSFNDIDLFTLIEI